MQEVGSDKRRKKVITLEKKLEALKRLEEGASLKKVAGDYGVGLSTVGDWKKNKDKIKRWCSVMTSPTPHQKTMKTAENKKVDDALFLWFTQQKSTGEPILGRVLQRKAMEIYESLPVVDAPNTFTASEGWLSRWKKRHGIHQMNIRSEKLYADETVDDFEKLFKPIMDEGNYTLDRRYFCGEVGLNDQMVQPNSQNNQSDKLRNEKSRGRTKICSKNSQRHKPLFADVGQSAKFRAIKSTASDNDDDLEEYTESDPLHFISQHHNEDTKEDAECTKICHADGLLALERSLQYVEHQPDATPADLLFLRRWKEYAARKCLNTSLKQTSILSYIKK